MLSIWLIVDPFPGAEPVTLTEGAAVHVNVVPATLLGVGRILIIAVPPLQIVTFDAVADGNGFTVTTRSTDRPSQPLKFGVILYVTIPSTFPVFIGVSVIEPVPDALTEPDEIVPLIELVHEKVVAPIVAVGVKLNGTPLHICCEKLDGVFVITGTGFTVAITSKAGPTQPLADGMIL